MPAGPTQRTVADRLCRAMFVESVVPVWEWEPSQRRETYRSYGGPRVRIHFPPGESPQTIGSADDFTRLIPII
jgi:hypothetical protein